MKIIYVIVCALFIMGYTYQKEIDGQHILEQTIKKHDPSSNWDTTKINIHVQEPRISNPYRYSIVTLDNANQYFKLSRNRDQHLSEHIIESDGKSTVLLDGKIETDTILIKKYRLDPSRNIGYQKFYRLMYGLPMSLANAFENISPVSESTFNKELCYKIEFELKEPMISKHWRIYVSKSDMMVKGIEIFFPDDPEKGERIYFEDLITINGVKIPRIRHWRELKDNTYSGSDLIIKVL